MIRTAISSVFHSWGSGAMSARALHSTPVAYKTVTEKVAEAADTVNKKVGKGLASAIETGESAVDKTTEVMGKTKKQASEASSVAGQKTNQAAAEAKEAKDDFKKEVKK